MERAILHIDGDSFFASCEVAKDPKLRGRPVVTGKERGIASSMTYEAKKRGVKRGMTLSEIQRVCPDAVILPSDYETYSVFSHRMYEIVRRWSPRVEEYSIDECFADLTGLCHATASYGHAEAGMRRSHWMSYQKIAAAIKNELERELGITFSIGLSVTKVLAKIGSRWKKPNGLTVISLKDAPEYLRMTPIGQIWGIGPNTACYLNAHGIHSAFEFAQKNERRVRGMLSKPFFEIWQELNGKVVNELDTDGRKTYLSVSKTKTFTPPSKDAAFVYSQLSKNIENACIKLRRWDLAASKFVFFLKTQAPSPKSGMMLRKNLGVEIDDSLSNESFTMRSDGSIKRDATFGAGQDFKYHACELKLPHPTSVPHDILKMTGEYFPALFRKNTLYRATGVTMLTLTGACKTQLDLFGAVKRSDDLKRIFESVDHLSERYGKHAVFLGTSLKAFERRAHSGQRGDSPERARNLFKGETKRRHLNIPMLGEVA